MKYPQIDWNFLYVYLRGCWWQIMKSNELPQGQIISVRANNMSVDKVWTEWDLLRCSWLTGEYQHGPIMYDHVPITGLIIRDHGIPRYYETFVISGRVIYGSRLKPLAGLNNLGDEEYILNDVVPELTSTDSLDMSTGVIRLSADSRCSRCRACSSTAMRNASWMMLCPMSDTAGR